MASKKKPNEINYGTKKEDLYGHSLTHSKGFQKAHGTAMARREHDKSVRVGKEHGWMKHHDTPFRPKVRNREPRERVRR